MKGAINLLIIVLILSCKNETKAKEDISFKYYNLEQAEWKSKTKNQQVDDVNFKGTEVPIQYYILKEMGGANLNAVDSVYQKNKTERLIEFEFEDAEERDLLKEEFTGKNYTESVKYMSFQIQKDFYIVVDKKDTIQCEGVLFERNFKLSPKNKLLLFFSGVNPNGRLQLVYKDELFKKGIIKFSFTDRLLKL
jgi:hypothetical protein